MGSRGVASYNDPVRRPPRKKDLPTPFVRAFREALTGALDAIDPASGKKLNKCIGVYAFYDYDGEPIYVGQTLEDFGTRIGRHLRGQRSDTLAYRILDPFEVAEVEMWPMEHTRSAPKGERQNEVNAVEYNVYVYAIRGSRYGAILNEKIPPISAPLAPPPSYRFPLVADALREEREHPDIRIARRAETLARVAAVAHERGEVSAGLRRVIVVQAIRLADLAAARLAYVEGRPRHRGDAIDMTELVGSVLAESDAEQTDVDED